MALDAATAQEMIKKLAEDQAQYLNTLNRAHEILAQALASAATGKPAPRPTLEGIRRNKTYTGLPKLDVESVKKDSKGSVLSAEDDESSTDDNESLFVSQHLPSRLHHGEDFKRHLHEHEWTAAGRVILHDVLENLHVLRKKRHIFPTAVEEQKHGPHVPHYSIFDVGPDGAPLPILTEGPSTSRAAEIWERIQKINTDQKKERKAVGRITIVREPTSLLFAALHYTQRDHFDMDEIFKLLVDTRTEALPPRPFSQNPKHRRTIIWTMEYFTVIGDECAPMSWLKADENRTENEDHIPISRCSSVIALSFDDEPMGQIRNKSRRQERRYGDVYDPFSPWHVLSIQAYPDWKSSIDSHNSSKHYVNGPEAFLVTLRAEFKDAQKRLQEVYKKISELVTTPSDFMFSQKVRDKLLFEDDEFTYSRRYFWAYQSLGIMNEDIDEMITAYRNTFTDDVWSGSDKIIWPGDETSSSRHAHWRKRMAALRKDIEAEIDGLEEIDKQNEEKMKEIKSLRDNLFSGTSVLESRKSVQQQAITVQQGHNIKLLTLVTIFFLPLTFVTSVFGMTNMKTNDSFTPFGITTLVICLPTYMLIGSLNTTSGMEFWRQKTKALFTRIGNLFNIFHPAKGVQAATEAVPPTRNQKPRSESASEGISARGGIGPTGLTTSGAFSHAMSPTGTTERTIHFQPSNLLESPKSPTFLQLERDSNTNANDDIGWFSRILSRKAKSTPVADTKELC